MAPCLPSHLTSAWSSPFSSPHGLRLRFCLRVFSSSQFRPFSWMPASRVRLLKAARQRNLRHIILNASAASLNEESILGENPRDKKLNADSILVVGEGFCISVAAAASIASLTMRNSEDSRLVESSMLEPLMPRKESLPQWQSFFLLAALIINVILRGRQWRGRGSSTSPTSKFAVADTDQRVRKLEEEVASVVTIVRMLSKQLEKLAVRFRVTRQTLRDPIQETALLAQKTSESLGVLAAKEDALEKSLNEIHHVLLGMQENQSKQLELIAALGKLVKVGQRERLEKPLLKGGRKENTRVDTQKDGMKESSSQGTLQSESRGFAWQETTGHQSMVRGEDPDSSLDIPKTNDRPQNTQRVDFWFNTPASSQSTKAEELARDVDSGSVRN